MVYAPLFDNILVKELQEKETIVTYSEHDLGKLIKAEVIAVGEGNWQYAHNSSSFGVREPLDINFKDIVYFRKHSAKEIALDGIDYYVVNARDILVKEANG